MNVSKPIGTSFWQQFKLQRRVIWALTMREVITRFGREGIGALWLIAEPAMFIVGVIILFSRLHSEHAGLSYAEYLAVSYPTLMFWRNGTGRVIKALEINRSLLHHLPIRPIDIIYARILLEFSGAAGSFIILFFILVLIGVCEWPSDALLMICGYLLVIFFSFAFVMIMAALAEMSDAIERISHIILYLMLPLSGVFVPLYTLPEAAREYLLWTPLINAVECFHAGYYGDRMITYYNIPYTLFSIFILLLIAYALTNISIRKVKAH